MHRYTHADNLGKAAEVLVIAVTSDECTDDLDEVSNYVENSEETLFAYGEQEYPKFDKWVNHLLQILDDVNPNVEIVSYRQSSL